MEDKQEKGTRKRRYCQAKNDLKNPSKGKYRRIAPAVGVPYGRSLDDEELLKRHGLKSSQIRLSPIRGHGDYGEKQAPADSPKKQVEKTAASEKTQTLADSPKKQVVTTAASEKTQGEVVGTMINSTKGLNKSASKKTVTMLADSDNDVEIIEDTVDCIVLDDDSSFEENVALNKDAELMKKFGVHNACVKLDPISSEQVEMLSPGGEVSMDHSFNSKKYGSKMDKDTVNVLGLKDLCVKLDKIDDRKMLDGTILENVTPAKMFGENDISPKKNTEHVLTPKSIVSVKKLDEMSPADLENLLKDCGMGVSLPWSASEYGQVKTSVSSFKSVRETVKLKASQPKDFPRIDVKLKRKQRSPSPQPSTSSGFRGKRKRTARKSVPSTDLAVKYNLKEPKILVKSLSKIEIALLKNPHSLFGKSDKSKHKFDSDNDSDEIDWDIPTSPTTDNIEENVHTSVKIGRSMSKQGSRKSFHTPATKTAADSKCININDDAEILRQFGLIDSKVVILPGSDCNVTNTVPKDVSKSTQDHKESDSQLLEKFGMSQAKVVVKGFKERQGTNAMNTSGSHENATTKSSTKNGGNGTRSVCKQKQVIVKPLSSGKVKQVSSKKVSSNGNKRTSKRNGKRNQGFQDAEMTKQVRTKKNVPVVAMDVEDIPPKCRPVNIDTKRKCRSALDKLRLKSLSRAKENATFGKLGILVHPIKQRTTNSSKKIRNDKNARTHLKVLKKPYTHAKLVIVKNSRPSKPRGRKSRKNSIVVVLSDIEDTESMNGAENKENEQTVTCRDEVDGCQMLRSVCRESPSDSENTGRKICDQTNEDKLKVVAKNSCDLTGGGDDHGHHVKTTDTSTLGNVACDGEMGDTCVEEDTSVAAACLVEYKCDNTKLIGGKGSTTKTNDREIASHEQDNGGKTKQDTHVVNNPGIIVDSTSHAVVGDLIINRCEVVIRRVDHVNVDSD